MLLARADASKETLERNPVDAVSVVQNAAEQGERLARSHGVGFLLKLPPGPIRIRADAEALRRALLILMDNAAKYTPRGGSVEVGLDMREGQAVAWVSDTGIGIDASDLPHGFDRFWRADKARPREHGGAGLGLSIARWIVAMHGGRIGVQSRPGKGSIFEIRVPIDSEDLVGRSESHEPAI
jgi:signal transduction histidine kinase